MENALCSLLTATSAMSGSACSKRTGDCPRRRSDNWLLIVNRRHLEHVLRVYVEHYNTERPHRALGLVPPDPHPPPGNATGEVKRRDRLGGLIHEYHRAA